MNEKDKPFAIIYHTKNCQKCRQTARMLNIKTELRLIDRANGDNSAIIDYMDSQGMSSAPLVRVYEDSQLVDEWNDFNISKIKETNKRYDYEIFK